MATQFFTVESASVQLQNDLDLRAKEYGTILPQAIVPGMRSVTLSMELLSQDDAATTGLYQAAKIQAPISVMFQLGQVQGQTGWNLHAESGTDGSGLWRRR